MTRRTLFDFDWSFHQGDLPGAEQPDFGLTNWRDVSLPHDWSIEGPFDREAPAKGSGAWLPGGVGWYRKTFELERGGGAVWIEFDGVYHNSDVWLNGHYLGNHPYGYGSFHYDLTPHLSLDGPNVLAVRVDNSDQPNCRWYSGSGIYRHVWLVQTGEVHIPPWGTYLTTPTVSAASAEVRLLTKVRTKGAAVSFRLETTLCDRAGREVAAQSVEGSVAPSGVEEVEQLFALPKPQLWSTDDPALYTAHSAVVVGGTPVDAYKTPFGLRDARFDKDKGFSLNGQNLKLKGVCLHHDGGAVGAAVPERVLERRLTTLKAFGCNAVRCSHNPPAPELLDLCDRLGLLVINEAFDKWDGGFSGPEAWWMRQVGFEAWWEEELRAMLERDRNHPCIVLWSVGNETGHPGNDEVNSRLEELVAFVHREEPSRPVTCALVNSDAKTLEERVSRTASSARLMDVLGLNYQEPLYPHLREAEPNTVILGTEVFKHWRGGEMLIHSFDPVNPWYDVVAHDYVAGQFLWAGIDYLGESSTWPDKGFNGCGLLDTCGFPKPEAWFQRSVWRSEPVVRLAVFERAGGAGEVASSWAAPKLLEHWNFTEYQGQLLRLQTQTNCETVELLLNGQSYGVRRSCDFPNAAIVWYLPFHPGTVEALGRNGKEVVARHALLTAARPAQLALLPDRTTLAADGQDVSHIEVQLLDDQGRLVPDDDRRVAFALSGRGRLVGVDNGDLLSLEPYKGDKRTTYRGRCLVLVQSQRQAGRVRLAARVEGLKATTLELDVAPYTP